MKHLLPQLQSLVLMFAGTLLVFYIYTHTVFINLNKAVIEKYSKKKQR